MDREINLIEYLPLYVQTYREIKHIMNAENPEVSLLVNEIERVKNNQFIQSCDLLGIKQFERILGIVPYAGDTLESRIKRVMLRWNDMIPYTWEVFVKKMDSILGHNWSVVTNFTNFNMDLTIVTDMFGLVDEIRSLVDEIIPANIVVTVSNKLSYSMGNNYYTPNVASYTVLYDIKN